MIEDQAKNKQAHHQRLPYFNESDHGLPLYSNYDHDSTALTSNSTPTSDIAVVRTQWFHLPQRESQQPTGKSTKKEKPRSLPQMN